MASSGEEVNAQEEEEVEYIEEVVEYEEGEEEEVEDGEAAAEGPTEDSAATADAKPQAEEPAAEQPATPSSDSSTGAAEEKHETATLPASTSASDLAADAAAQPAPATPESQPEPADSTAAAAAAAESKGPAVELDLKQLEAQAAKVAKEVSHLALDVSSKLTAGLRSAFGGGGGSDASGGGSGGAGASLSKLAGGLSSWWGSLDPAPAPQRDETAERVAASNKASGELQALFGLSPEENLVEHFKCKLLQTYACSHNNHTPAIQMAFQGTLYVTDRHTCFSVEERGRKVPFKVPHSAVVRATRQRPARKGDLSDVLKLELSSGQWLAFKDFDSGSALDSALALVEHLTEAG